MLCRGGGAEGLPLPSPIPVAAGAATGREGTREYGGGGGGEGEEEMAGGRGIEASGCAPAEAAGQGASPVAVGPAVLCRLDTGGPRTGTRTSFSLP